MAGIQDFTYFNIGKETTRGTPVAPTRQLYLEGTGVLEPTLGLNFHEGENAGRRSMVRRATAQGEDVTFRARSANGFPFDSFVFPLSQLKGGMTGTGAGADKTWAAAPAMTGNNNPEAYSIDVGDDTQNYRLQYAMLRRFRQTAGLGDLTQVEFEGFAQRSVKTAKASPAANLAVVIPGDLWTWKFAATFAGLPGASVVPNMVIEHDLEVMTGLIWEHYQDGNMFGSQHHETSIGGTLKLVVASTAAVITEFYDKWATPAAGGGQTISYVRAKATSPVVLGGSFYSLQYDMPVIYEDPKVIARERNGVNLYEVTGRLVDDGTNPPISPTLVCSLAALP